jgi:inorganic pyrophosphatase
MTGVSSLAQDGDPIDALAVHDGGTYPGVILPCRPLGVVDLIQEGAKGPIENPRLILMPIWHDRMKAAHRLVNASLTGGNNT